MLNEKGFATSQDVAEIDEKLKLDPTNPALWCLRGDLILLLDDSPLILTLEDAEHSYKKAIEVDPSYYDAYESLGHYYDCVQDDPQQAIPFFRRALALGAGDSAQEGLAQALSQISE